MVLHTFLHVARSVASGFCRHRSERPGTALRTLCIVAFDFMARADGQRLGREQRRVLSRLLDLGALMNDHFDQHGFCIHSYRKLRKQLAADEMARAAYRSYFRQLRQVERNRPRLSLPIREGILKEAADYRETVVRISLSALAAIAFGQRSAHGACRIHNRNIEPRCDFPGRLRSDRTNRPRSAASGSACRTWTVRFACSIYAICICESAKRSGFASS
jgi:hypothetical protein